MATKPKVVVLGNDAFSDGIRRLLADKVKLVPEQLEELRRKIDKRQLTEAMKNHSLYLQRQSGPSAIELWNAKVEETKAAKRRAKGK